MCGSTMTGSVDGAAAEVARRHASQIAEVRGAAPPVPVWLAVDCPLPADHSMMVTKVHTAAQRRDFLSSHQAPRSGRYRRGILLPGACHPASRQNSRRSRPVHREYEQVLRTSRF